MIVLAAMIQAKSGKEQELTTLLKSLFPKVKQEAGVVEYVLHSSQSVPGKFFFYEKYKDKQAFDNHMNTSYLQEVFSQFDSLVVGEPQVELYEDIASIAN
jgi:quinol monooxygenase YgiN